MKVFAVGDIEIQVWPRDHRPVHCHVFVGNCEFRVFLPDYSIEAVEGSPLPKTKVIKEVLEIVGDNKRPIGQAWRKFHGD